MRLKISIQILNLIFASLLFSQISIGQAQPQGEGERVPRFETIANHIHRLARSRSVYLLVAENDFSKESVSKIFQDLDKTFCDPFSLSITIFSDRKMLDWFIKGRAADVVDFDYSTEKGKKAAAEYLRRIYPPTTGYFRAHYYRNERWEYFEYSPAADLKNLRRIVIRDSGTGINSDGLAEFPKSECKSN